MNDYRLIFQQRANDYHKAMQSFPNARFHEFKNLISTTDFSKVSEVLDIPSGGGYLRKNLPNHVNLTSVDFSEGFIDEKIKLVSPEKLPFESNTFHAVFSLSGMHHLKNVPQFVEECLRTLKEEGTFTFAEVKKDTSVDIFLNDFVNKYNSLGHRGDFFFEDYFNENPKLKSKIIDCQYKGYPFLFDTNEDMIHFFKLFFGLDKASNEEIYEGVKDILGIKTSTNGIEVNWGLILFQFKK